MRGTDDRKNAPRGPGALTAAAVAAAGFLLAGCQMYPAKPAVGPRVIDPEIDDPCILRLEEVSGQVCLYYNAKRELPENLEDLEEFAGGAMPPLVCPKCGKPYLYSREGLEVYGADKLVIVYDPEPCHDGKRRVIIIDPIRPGKGLITDVKTFFDGPMFYPQKQD